MDAYEAFYDEYCDFMVSYQKNPTDFTLILKYTGIVARAEQMDGAFKKWNDSDMTDEETRNYLEVNGRVTQKLALCIG